MYDENEQKLHKEAKLVILEPTFSWCSKLRLEFKAWILDPHSEFVFHCEWMNGGRVFLPEKDEWRARLELNGTGAADPKGGSGIVVALKA